MPGKVKVKIIAGRNLPVMDRSSDTTDAYVEIKLGNTTYKTDVCRKSLNPQWNSEWYRFEVDDSELQDEPLQIRLMDHDTYSANDAIGKVYLNLNPLLIPAVAIPKYGWSGDANLDQPSSSMMTGWIPVYDTMHGIRGEVNVTVKVELFSDFNKFRQSSCGVHFFCSPVIPHGYHAQVIHGFIEELVVNDDPEYQWIDKIRTPRASNEARQTLFFKLSGELQRKIGVKALDLGGNAVIGYNQCFDLEGESGIVARGIGTVVTLIKHHEMQQQLTDIGIAEEKALSYLKFLAFDNGLKLENDNKFECLSLSPQSNPKSITSSLFINPPPIEEQYIRKSPRRNMPLFIRQSSQPLIQLDYHSPILKPCISSQSLSDDIKEEIALRQLIQQEDMRNGSISSTSLTRRMRYLKQNILTKKMIALKAKLSDTTMPEHLDFSSSMIKKDTAPIRSSLIDLRELRKKKKSRMHQNNSSYMAELLVRSVMHAHTSLDCILECHDSTLSSSTSKLNEDHGECSSMQSSESKKTVLECEAIGGLITKTISEPFLLLPDNTIVTQSSNASSDSDVSSSSDVSESPSDSKEEKMDFDTVSLIVKNVQQEEEIREREQCGQLHFSFLDPPDRTSIGTDFEVEVDPIEEEKVQEENLNIEESIIINEDIKETLEEIEVKTEDVSSPLPTFNKTKLNSLFRSHALNISFDVPATAPVYLEDRKEVFTFPVDIDKKIEKLSHSALFNHSFRMHGLKKPKLHKGFSRSCEDVTAEIKSETTSEKMHLLEKPEETEKKRKCFAQSAQLSQSNPNLRNAGLVTTAINTMLMEKIDLMTPDPAPVSPKIKTPWTSRTHSSSASGNSSLMKTAMQTMLMDKINLMSPVGAPVSRRAKEQLQLQSSVSKSFSKSDPDLHSHSLLKSALHTVQHLPHHIFHHKTRKLQKTMSQSHPELSVTEKFMDKIHHITHPHHSKEEPEPEHHTVKEKFIDKIHHITHPHHPKDEPEPELEHHTVKEKLMDKIHHIAHPHHPKDEPEELEHHTVKEKFMDKIHFITHAIPHHHGKTLSTSHPDLRDHHSVKEKFMDKIHFITQAMPHPHLHHHHHKHKETNLIKLKETSRSHGDLRDHEKHAHASFLEKIHALKSPTKAESNLGHHSLVKTAMQTMLLDKVNILTPPSSPKNEEEFEYNDVQEETPSSDCTSVKTELDLYETQPYDPTSTNFEDRKQSIKHELNLDKIKTVVHSVIEHLTPSSKSSGKEFNFEKHDPSLMETAMQTMLLDKVHILNPNSPTSEFEEPFFPNNQELANIVDISELPPDMESNRKHDPVEKKSSFFGSLKKKCKKSFTKLIHRKDSQKSDGMVESAMSTILMDRVNNLMTPNEDPPLQNPFSFQPKAFSKQTIDDLPLTLPSAEEQPNIKMRLDNGVTYNNGTPAITSKDANCNTNAEHVPCLYTSDRRIVESPIPERESTREREKHGHQRTESTGGKMSQSPARLNAIPCIHRRSSDSDLSITPKVGINRKRNSLTGSDRSGGAIPGYHHIRSTLLRPTVDNFDMMEYPFLTMSKYPPGFILHLGGAVSARSVKLLERITNIEEPETRDTWWSELRMEIRTHARALNCNAVLGYQESTSICDEVCVLSAAGTAAVIALYSGELSDGVSGLPNLHKPHIPNKDLMTSSLDRTDFERDSKTSKHVESSNTNNKITESPEHEATTIEFSGTTNPQQSPTACRICHIPYSESSMSFRINMLYCSICKLAKVPDIILATIEMPEGLPITGRGCFLQSYVCRPKRDLKGELNAKEISESLPFLEYELHRLLVNKMKVKAMNTIFGLKVRITIGERMLVGIATGTAVFLLPLPPPPLPKLIAGNATTEDKKLSEMQKLLVDTVKKNKEIYELKDQDFLLQSTRLLSDTEESDDEKSNIDLAAGNKDSCVLEVDDSEDIEVINLLVEPRPPDGFHVVNTENVPGLEELEIVRNLQMFTQVWRTKIPLNQSVSHFGKHFQKILQSVYFKLRRMIPCALCDLQFRVDLPEPDEIQLTLLGMALGLGDPMKLNKFKRKNLSILPTKELTKKTDDELIFSLEEDHIPENSVPVICQSGLLNPQVPKHRQKSPQRLRMNPKQRHTPIKERHGVDITPLSYVPGGKIERYLGYLNFFFIRETTSIREGGGLSGFVHSFITEVLAIVRAHVTALGGNAMVAYFMTECVLCHNAHKNQGQCLINVGGDVVFVSYFTEDN